MQMLDLGKKHNHIDSIENITKYLLDHEQIL